MIGSGLGILAAVLSLAAWAVWLQRIRRVSVPRDRSFFVGSCSLAVVLGVAAFAVGVGWIGGTFATLGILAGGAFVLLRALSGQDARTPAVAVGGPLLAFSARDDSGGAFELSSLSGRPILLKFFRGHW